MAGVGWCCRSASTRSRYEWGRTGADRRRWRDRLRRRRWAPAGDAAVRRPRSRAARPSPSCLRRAASGRVGFLDARELRTLARDASSASGRPGRAGRRRPPRPSDRSPTSEQIPTSRTWTPARLALLTRGSLALAAWLRATGLSFGLPAVYNPDEVAIMNRAPWPSRTGDLNPHNFLYPTFYFYVLFAWEAAGSAFAGVTRRRVVARRVPAHVLRRSVQHLPRRPACSARSAASLTVVRHVDPRRAAARSARAGAVPRRCCWPWRRLAVRDAHYVKHDVPVTLAIVAGDGRPGAPRRVGEAADAVVERPSRAGAARRRRRVAAWRSRRTTTRSFWRCRWRSRSPRAGAIGRPPGHRVRRGRARGGVRLGGARRGDRVLRAVAVPARRTGDGLAGHRRQPPDRGRSRRRARQRPVPQRGAYLRLLWREGRSAGRARGRRDRVVLWPAAPVAGGAAGGVPGRVPAVPRQHGRGEPLPQPAAALPGRVRRGRAGAAGALDAADGHPRGDRWRSRRVSAQPRGSACSSGRPTPAPGAGVDRGARAARRHDPRAALLACR